MDHAMIQQGLINERERFQEYLNERPSTQEARGWLEACDLDRVETIEYPLEVKTGPGAEFLHHPLLRGGFLEDVYECFQDQDLADGFMEKISEDMHSFTPLIAQRCVLSGWKRS
jgi:hypothetical protein